jgi:very-short-patch-repair endonuclease
MRGEVHSRPGRGVETGVVVASAGRERAIAELAGRQRGVVTRAQLLRVGLTPGAIDHRLASARLHPVYRGVYLVGHPVPVKGARELAAVLTCGRGAVLSHRSAASLWRLLPNAATEIDVTLVGRKCESRPGIRVHCVAALDRRDVRKLGGIPVTAPARTILDLAAVVTSRELERALAEADTRRLAPRTQLLSLLARVGARRGVGALRSLIEGDAGPALTRSEAEEQLLALIRAAELPSPELNVRVGGHEVDFLWRHQGVVVEVDGFRYHSSRAAFERDRRRDAEFGARGFTVMRITWRQIVGSPEVLVARIAMALGAGERGATPASPRGRGAAP